MAPTCNGATVATTSSSVGGDLRHGGAGDRPASPHAAARNTFRPCRNGAVDRDVAFPYVIEQFDPEQIVILDRDEAGALTGQPIDKEAVKPKTFRTERRQFAEAKDARLPRIAVLIRPADGITASSVIETCHGDVLRPVTRGRHIICQMVNDSAYRWGGGVAAQTGRDYPAAQSAFETWMKALPRAERLGKTHFHEVQPERTIASLVAQEGFGKSDAPRLRYAALSQTLHAVAERAIQIGASVHMPKLGTGAAGGSWPMIEELVVEEFIRRDISVLVYEPAPRPRRNPSQADLFS